MQYSPFVAELEPKADIEGAFLVKFLSVQTDKRGKEYLNLILMDRSGEVEARIWEDASAIASRIQAKDIVRVSGRVNLYQGRKQLLVNAIEKAAENLYPRERFVPASCFSLERMFADLMTIVESLEDPFAQQLAKAVLTDPKVKPRFIEAPAAKSVHHAYAGGLLEHVLSVCRILSFLGLHYRAYYGKALNRDLLILGAIFHDIGKIEELDWERGTEYSHSGRLIGHLVQGCELLDRFADQIPNFPDDLRLLLKHQILAHHGKLEYGSPKLPATMEALIVHYIDDLDSKVNSIFGIIERDATPGRWTGFNKLYERMFLKPDPLPTMQGASPGVTD